MILRLLNPQGIAGIVASLALGLLLILSHAETRHWKKQSAQFEQLYRDGEAALAGTVANYRAAADAARAADRANAARVADAQRGINERTKHAYEERIAGARAVAANIASGRLRAPTAPAHPGGRGGAPVPGVAAATQGAAHAAGEDRLSHSDALIATEQAIQLDELIEWVKAQAKVDNNAAAIASDTD
jgi:hypothetical protein